MVVNKALFIGGGGIGGAPLDSHEISRKMGPQTRQLFRCRFIPPCS